jgi:hypothetical protein
MANKKIYFNENADNQTEFEAYRNKDGDLFINVSPFPGTHSSDVWLVLPKKDAIELISELAFDFDLIDDDIELEGKMMWQGNSR